MKTLERKEKSYTEETRSLRTRKKEDKIMQVEIYERDAFMTTQEKSKILCRLKYTKESFALNIQTNNITWDLWWYVVGILLPLG